MTVTPFYFWFYICAQIFIRIERIIRIFFCLYGPLKEVQGAGSCVLVQAEVCNKSFYFWWGCFRRIGGYCANKLNLEIVCVDVWAYLLHQLVGIHAFLWSKILLLLEIFSLHKNLFQCSKRNGKKLASSLSAVKILFPGLKWDVVGLRSNIHMLSNFMKGGENVQQIALKKYKLCHWTLYNDLFPKC